MSIGYQI